jgi:hypothetical protein
MLTDSLRNVVAQMEHLPEAEQETLAAAILAELEMDKRWEVAMASPDNLVLDRLIAEAQEEVARGEARDLDELL